MIFKSAKLLMQHPLFQNIDCLGHVVGFLDIKEQLLTQKISKSFKNAFENCISPIHLNEHETNLINSLSQKLKGKILKRVVHLNLSITSSLDERPLSIPKCTNLRYLNLENRVVPLKIFSKVFSKFSSKLETLNLSGSLLNQQASQILGRVSFEKLKDVNLNNNFLDNICIYYLRLDTKPLLQRLILSSNFIETSGFKILCKQNLPNLTFLDISNNNIHFDDSFQNFNAFFPSLTNLNLRGNTITIDGMKFLTRHLFSKCTHLDLSLNQITDDCIQEFKFDFTHLKELYLNQNSISDVGVQHIVNLKIPNLLYLNLSDNILTDASTFLFSKNLLPKVEIIDLSFNQISYFGSRNCYKKERIKNIKFILNGNPISHPLKMPILILFLTVCFLLQLKEVQIIFKKFK